MKISRALLAAVVLAMGLAAAPVAADPSQECPSFNSSGAFTHQPDPDPNIDIGPFGTSNQRLRGVGLELQGDVLVATIQVEDMKKQIMPPDKATYWQLQFTLEETHKTFEMTASYDGIEDTWRYILIEGGSRYRGKVTGSHTLGPNGIVRMSVPIAQFDAAPGMLLNGVYGESGSLTYWPESVFPDDVGGHWSARWMKKAFDSFPLIPCPGITLAAESGDGPILALGHMLPQRADMSVTIERQTPGGAWEAVANVGTDERGFYETMFPLPAGSHTLRAITTLPSLGTVISVPVTVLMDE